MPASGIKCLMTIQDDRFGVGEFHVLNSNDFAVTRQKFINLFKQRMLLCGPPALAFRGRLSLIGSRRITQMLSKVDLLTAGVAPSMTFSGSGGTSADNTSDQPKSAIQLLLTTADNSTHSTYLGGVPDVIIRESPEGPAVGIYPGYLALLNQFIAMLINDQWGTIVRAKSPATTLPKAIETATVNDASGFAQVSCTSYAPELAVNQKVCIRGFLPVSNAYSKLTGIYRIASVTPNAPVNGKSTYELRDSSGLNLTNPKSLGTIELVDYTFSNYTVGSVGLQTTRKRGNRSLAGVGRLIRPARV